MNFGDAKYFAVLYPSLLQSCFTMTSISIVAAFTSQFQYDYCISGNVYLHQNIDCVRIYCLHLPLPRLGHFPPQEKFTGVEYGNILNNHKTYRSLNILCILLVKIFQYFLIVFKIKFKLLRVPFMWSFYFFSASFLPIPLQMCFVSGLLSGHCPCHFFYFGCFLPPHPSSPEDYLFFL